MFLLLRVNNLEAWLSTAKLRVALFLGINTTSLPSKYNNSQYIIREAKFYILNNF